MSYFLRSALTVLLVAYLLAACAKDPGAAFFALESELIDRVEPHGLDSEKARAALCKWFREEGPRIRETHKAYEDYLAHLKANPDPDVKASLKSMQEALNPRFDRIVLPLFEDDNFVEVSRWFSAPESTDLEKACAATGIKRAAAPSAPVAVPSPLTSPDYRITFPAAPSSQDLDKLRKHHEARLGAATFILTEIIVEPSQTAILVPSPFGMFLADVKRFAKSDDSIVRQGAVAVGGRHGYEVVYDDKAEGRVRHMRFVVASDRLYRLTTIVPNPPDPTLELAAKEFVESFQILREDPQFDASLTTYTSGTINIEVVEPPENQVVVPLDGESAFQAVAGSLPWPAHTCLVLDLSAEQLTKIETAGMAAVVARLAGDFLEAASKPVSADTQIRDVSVKRWTVDGRLKTTFGGGDGSLYATLTPDRLLLLGLTYPGGAPHIERCWKSARRVE